MKVTLHTIYLILAMVLSPTLFAALPIFGVKPNLFLIYLVLAGFYVSKKEGIWLGLIFGFAFDIIVGRKIGLNGVLYMYACYFVVLLRENMIRRTNAIVVVLCVAIWTVIFEGITAVFGGGGVIYALKTLGIEAAYNSGLALVFYGLLHGIFGKIYDEIG